jgi:hypothetical protein
MGGGESIIILIQKLNRVGTFIITVVAAPALPGMNVTATLTSLGMGTGGRTSRGRC